MLKPKFKLGQEVYYCIHSTKPYTETCKTCGGSGTIPIANFDTSTISCPKCYKKGFLTCYSNSQWHVVYHPSRIGRINTEEYAQEYLENQEYNYKNTILYMLVQTGVGSGILWSEEKLYSSKEKAEKWCKEQNKRLENEKSKEIKRAN